MHSGTFIPKTWSLPDAITRRLGDSAGRQRLMDEDGHLLFILHQAPRPEDEEHRKPFLLWNHPDGTWKSSPTGGGLSALTEHLDYYRKQIHAIDDAVDTAQTPKDYFEVMKRVNPMVRATRHLQSVLQNARQARPEERRLIVARDSAIELERAIELAAADARSGMEFSLAVNSEAQARAGHQASEEARKLNRLVAFFFPLATLVAVFGMNSPKDVLVLPGFWAVLVIGVLAGAFIWALSFRKN